MLCFGAFRDAWNSLGDMAKEEAMAAYVDEMKLVTIGLCSPSFGLWVFLKSANVLTNKLLLRNRSSVVLC